MERISPTKHRIESIDLLRGLAMMVMVLDHVRMYFGYGFWYVNPTDLSTASLPLFFTRWITHFGAPSFVFLSGTAAFLYGTRYGLKQVSRFLWTRGVWLIFVEITILGFAWTFDITFGRILLQVLWAIGISMICLSFFVLLPRLFILIIGICLALCHNVLDSITAHGSSITDIVWYALHQKHSVALGHDHLVVFLYPLLPWIGLMSLGYVFGIIYQQGFNPIKRRNWLWGLGIGSILLFILLRGFHMYGRGIDPGVPDTHIYYWLTFINTNKYPPSVLFLLMSMGPTFIFLALIGGAIYFVIISLKDRKKRESWVEQAFE